MPACQQHPEVAEAARPSSSVPFGELGLGCPGNEDTTHTKTPRHQGRPAGQDRPSPCPQQELWAKPGQHNGPGAPGENLAAPRAAPARVCQPCTAQPHTPSHLARAATGADAKAGWNKTHKSLVNMTGKKDAPFWAEMPPAQNWFEFSDALYSSAKPGDKSPGQQQYLGFGMTAISSHYYTASTEVLFPNHNKWQQNSKPNLGVSFPLKKCSLKFFCWSPCSVSGEQYSQWWQCCSLFWNTQFCSAVQREMPDFKHTKHICSSSLLPTVQRAQLPAALLRMLSRAVPSGHWRSERELARYKPSDTLYLGHLWRPCCPP